MPSCKYYGTHVRAIGTTSAFLLADFTTFQKDNPMVRKLVALLCAASFVMLTACNTMEGAGKDIQRGGEKVESAADKNKK